MLTDPQIVLARLERYSHLNASINKKWVQRIATKRSIAIWHPLFEEDEAIASRILGSIDNVIGMLRQEHVAGVDARAKGLCASTYDNFWSSWTELVQGAKLCSGYPLRYLPEQKGARTPDIELDTSRNGHVYVEITAMHKTWDFNAIQRYIHDALGDVQHRYRIAVTCSTDIFF
jgi:hypothetical protein